jgi:hypothetical protein
MLRSEAAWSQSQLAALALDLADQTFLRTLDPVAPRTMLCCDASASLRKGIGSSLSRAKRAEAPADGRGHPGASALPYLVRTTSITGAVFRARP